MQKDLFSILGMVPYWPSLEQDLKNESIKEAIPPKLVNKIYRDNKKLERIIIGEQHDEIYNDITTDNDGLLRMLKNESQQDSLKIIDKYNQITSGTDTKEWKKETYLWFRIGQMIPQRVVDEEDASAL